MRNRGQVRTTAVTGAIVDELIKVGLMVVKDAGGKSHAQLLYPDDYDFSKDNNNSEQTNEVTQ